MAFLESFRPILPGLAWDALSHIPGGHYVPSRAIAKLVTQDHGTSEYLIVLIIKPNFT
jgi:hypothetical protein